MLVPRGGAWGERVAAGARARGLTPVVVPLIRDVAPDDVSALEAAVDRLVASGASRRRGSPDLAADGAQVDASSSPSSSMPSPSAQDMPSVDRRVSATGRPAGADTADRAHSAPPAEADPGADPGYAWLVVTSATAVRVLAERVARLPSALRVAAVGDATARAARAAHWRVDLVPTESSAAHLADALPDTRGTVLFPRSDLAAPTLVDALRGRGIDVDDVVAYRTVGTGDEPITLDPPPGAVLVTSGSIARQVVRRMTPLDPRTVVACIGPGTASDARAAGLPVHVVARERSAEALLDAVAEILRTAPEQEGTP